MERLQLNESTADITPATAGPAAHFSAAPQPSASTTATTSPTNTAQTAPTPRAIAIINATVGQGASATTAANNTTSTGNESDNRFWLWKILTNWTSRSPALLRAVEQRILSFLATDFQCFYTDIGNIFGAPDQVWTIQMNASSKEIPLVMLHGLGGGIALWVLNYDAIARDRPVYAMDIIGFGRSSRPTFAKEALQCEEQFVEVIETWRKQMNIKSMILLGHSMGGFLATSYAMNYPQYVKHLILADPWGFSLKPEDVAHHPQIPFWARASSYAIPPLNPLWPLRAAGPLGKWIIQRARADVVHKFSDIIKDDASLVPQYIHQCNVQTPSGETAFHTMMDSYAWAKYPMINRIHQLHAAVHISFIFGSKSWVDASVGEAIKAKRPHSNVNVHIVENAGHHVYAMQYEIFNDLVNTTCANYKLDQRTGSMSYERRSSADYHFDYEAEDDDDRNNGDEDDDDDDDESQSEYFDYESYEALAKAERIYKSGN